MKKTQDVQSMEIYLLFQNATNNSQYPTSTQPETPSSPAVRQNNKVGQEEFCAEERESQKSFGVFPPHLFLSDGQKWFGISKYSSVTINTANTWFNPGIP